MSLWIHLAINVMSTLLLSASNCEFISLFFFFLGWGSQRQMGTRWGGDEADG